MALEMRQRCERCDTPLTPEGEAFICSRAFVGGDRGWCMLYV